MLIENVFGILFFTCNTELKFDFLLGMLSESRVYNEVSSVSCYLLKREVNSGGHM